MELTREIAEKALEEANKANPGLKNYGCLKGMSQSNQMSLFA